jgi:hypothetical protein
MIGCTRQNYSPTEIVEGTVTLDGISVTDAEVSFYPVQLEVGESAMGRTDHNGVYRLSSIKGAPGKGTVAADYNVTVSKFVTTEIENPYYDPKQDAVIKFESKELLPAAYTDVEFSPLTVTVINGKNVIDLKLNSNVVSKKKKNW